MFDCVYVLKYAVFWLLQEVRRIRNARMDDPAAIINDRVKGSLKVTRAFGAGYLKNVKTSFSACSCSISIAAYHVRVDADTIVLE